MNTYLLIQYTLLGIILCWVIYIVVKWIKKSKKNNGLSCSGCSECALKESCTPKIKKKNNGCTVASPKQPDKIDQNNPK